MSSRPLHSLLTSLCRFRANRLRDRAARPHFSRLQVESLEDRLVPSVTTLVSGLNHPFGVAVDGMGNVYIADTSNNAIKEWMKGSNTVTTLVSTGLSGPDGVAVDGMGNVYIADTNNNAIKKWDSSTNSVTTLVSSPAVFLPTGIALDGSGNVYIADYGQGTVEEWMASTSTLIPIVSSGLSRPSGVAVDGSGNVYIAGYGDNTIKEWVKSSNTVTTLVSTGLNTPFGVAVDGSGNVYIGDSGNNELKEWMASSNTVVTLVASGLSLPSGVALDSGRNLYFADYGNNAIKEFTPPPSITIQPQNTSATVGQAGPAYFTVSATGSTLSYQWQISTDNGATFTNLNDGGGVIGATSSILVLSGFATPGTAEYQVVVSDSGGAMVTSNAATFTVNPAPTISAQPQNAAVTAGQAGAESFLVAVSGGTGPLTVEWQISTDNGASFSTLTDGNGVAGATTTTLSVSGFAAAGSALYRAMVFDANGVTATSSAATLTINARPSITSQPANQSATVGQAGGVSFNVVAALGTSPFTYQWQISTNGGSTFTNVSNGAGISGATNATLTISGSALPSSTTEYNVVVTDANSVTVTSTTATLSINALLSIATQPQSATATAGQSAPVAFTIAASGGMGPFAVQWQISTNNGASFTNLSDGSGITGSTTTTLTINGFMSAGSPEYRALVTDANSVTATSNAATLIVNAAPSITSQPQNATAIVGQAGSLSFAIAAGGGTGQLTVQWQISTGTGSTFTNLSDGSGVAGSATPTLTISNFTSAGTTAYQAIVTDANGVTATSNTAILLVNAPGANPNQSWLAQVYADLFRRALDSSGLATWGNMLNQGVTRTEVVSLIEGSLEYRADVVDALYVQLLRRPADASGLNGYTSFLGNGGTAQQVEAAIIGSLEYYQLHGGTSDGFLVAVYQDVLNRPLDASGAQSWGMALTTGSTRAAVAANILASLESDTDEVQSLFSEFLHRTADPSGLNSFTTALQQGVATEVAIAGIVGSAEYFARTL